MNKIHLKYFLIVLFISGLISLRVTAMEATFLSRYDSQAGFNKGGAEIVVYDPINYRVYVTNGADKAVDILDLRNPYNIRLIKRVSLDILNFGTFIVNDVTSVSVHPTGNFIAVAITAYPKTKKGIVAFLNTDGKLLGYIKVGSLPDMVTFTPDGNSLLVANEGEPNDEYTVDPEGSISIIDISSGIKAAKVFNVRFNSVTDDKIDKNIRIYGPSATLAQDLEPEYIAVSPDSKTAYVTLQENNGLAKIDLPRKKCEYIYSFGYKDHSIKGNELDASNEDGRINIRNWPLLGMYLPDGIDIFTENGEIYIVTANEGDTRDYGGFSEDIRVGDIVENIRLNAEYYQGYTQSEIDAMVNEGLFYKYKLGRIKITSTKGMNRNKVYEALYSYGGRSFSIWKPTETGLQLIFDSGSQFEKISSRVLGYYFNTNNDKTNFDGRSDNKGPEPEDIKIGMIDGKRYAFIGLERVSGIMVYNITIPTKPIFVKFLSSRDYSVQLANFDPGDKINAGDVAPEGLRFIPANKSPNGRALLLVASEISGTVAVFEIINY